MQNGSDPLFALFAVDFSSTGDTISIGLAATDDELVVSVTNPGSPLPERMRTQMFDSMVSMRSGENTRHLGLGLYLARLIAAGHGGRIDGGVIFRVSLPRHKELAFAVAASSRDLH